MKGEGGLTEEQHQVKKVFDDLFHLFIKKNNDYGSSVFQLADLAPGVSVEDAIAVRMSDKVKRINSLRQRAGNQGQVKDESLDDTIEDLAVYGILWLAHRRNLRVT